MKAIISAFAILLAGAVCLTTGSCRSVELPEFAEAGIVNNPVNDTLFIYLKDFEDAWVNIHIHDCQVNYAGHEQVTNGKVWFRIGHLPTGYYTVWIEFGEYRFTQRIWHNLTYY